MFFIIDYRNILKNVKLWPPFWTILTILHGFMPDWLLIAILCKHLHFYEGRMARHVSDFDTIYTSGWVWPKSKNLLKIFLISHPVATETDFEYWKKKHFGAFLKSHISFMQHNLKQTLMNYQYPIIALSNEVIINVGFMVLSICFHSNNTGTLSK